MAAIYLDQCRDDDRSVRSHINCPDEHSSLNEGKSENRRFKSRSLCKFLRRHLGRSKFASQKRTEKPRVAFGERVERPKNSFKKGSKTSKSSLKKRIRASKDMTSQLGKRIQQRFVKTMTKFRRVCGRKRDDNRSCPCARYVKVSRDHSLAATNDSTADLHKQLKSTGHLSKNWQEPDNRPTSVDVRKINHFFSTSRSSSHTIYQCVSYLNGNEHIEALASTAACRYGEGIDEIHSLPSKGKSLRALFRRWRYGKRSRFSGS